MPCSDPQWMGCRSCEDYAKKLQAHVAKIQELTQMACELCQYIEGNGWNVPGQAKEWWKAHKLSDEFEEWWNKFTENWKHTVFSSEKIRAKVMWESIKSQEAK